MKQEREFFDTAELAWAPSGTPGVTEKVLSRGAGEVLTRLARWEPGLDTSAAGVIRHEYVEEVYLLEGDLTDLSLGRTFHAGEYASRPVGMPHGPYRTDSGCTMLEVRSQRAPRDAVDVLDVDGHHGRHRRARPQSRAAPQGRPAGRNARRS